MKKILLIIGTHGNEKIGIEVLRVLRKQGYQIWFDFLVANPKALNKDVRFIEADLNRVYPGKRNSSIYEENLAYKNINKARQYDYVIDIHEASCGIDDFIIVPKKSIPTRFPLELIDLERIILWPDPKGPLGQFLDNAIELEFGMRGRNRKEVIERAVVIIKQFIRKIQLPDLNELEYTRRKDVYFVYGKLKSDEYNKDIGLLKDFVEIKINGASFYPLLVGQYLREKIACYKMKKMSDIIINLI